MKYILVLCGLSASGKDTILNMIDPIFERLVSHTTRPKRQGEVDGVDYHFIDADDFLAMYVYGEIIEDRTYYTIENGKSAVWHYGLHKSELEKDASDYVVIMDYQGIQQLKEKVDNDIKIIVAYVEASDEKRLDRVKKRGGEIAEFERRDIADKKSFEGCKENSDIIIFNENDSDIRREVIRLIARYNDIRRAMYA